MTLQHMHVQVQPTCHEAGNHAIETAPGCTVAVARTWPAHGRDSATCMLSIDESIRER